MVDVNCGRKDGRMERQMDRQTEKWAPISHLANAGATKMITFDMDIGS